VRCTLKVKFIVKMLGLAQRSGVFALSASKLRLAREEMVLSARFALSG